MTIWILEGALVIAALLFRKVVVLRYVVVLGVVLLLHTPLMALYNVAGLAGIALCLRGGGALVRVRAVLREPLVLLLIGMLGVLAISTVLARGTVPGPVWASSMRGLLGIAAAGSLLLFAFLDEGDGARRSWGLAFAVSVLILCGLRLVSDAGVDLYPTFRVFLDAEPPGQPLDFGSRNILGGILNAALPVLLLVGRAEESRAAGAVRYLAAALAIYTLDSLQSRTGTLVLTLSLLSLLVFLRLKNRGALRPVLFAIAVFLVVVVLPGRRDSRPILVKETPAAPDESVGTIRAAVTPRPRGETPPAAARVEGRPASEAAPLVSVEAVELTDYLFRIALTDDSHAFAQSFLVSHPEQRFQIQARATPACRGRLRILVNGVPLLTIRGREGLPQDFEWRTFSLPSGIEAGKWNTITFVAEGDLSPVDSYYEISALRYTSDVVRAEFLVHGRPVEGDISSDAGRQEGIALVLLGERRVLPPGKWLEPRVASSALDQSLRDRVELWKIAWEHALQRPVFGWGFYTFGYYFPLLSADRGFFDDYANAHSMYFELLHDGGFLAMLLVASVAVAAVLTLRRQYASGLPTKAAALAVALSGFLLNSVTQVTLADQRYYALVSILLGLLLGEKRRRPVWGSLPSSR